MDKCPHNSGVECAQADPQKCARCGWSPEGTRRRKGPASDRSVVTPEPSAPHRGGHYRSVAKITPEGTVIATYPSIVAAAEANHMTAAGVKNHLRGSLKDPFKCTGGYTFRYADQIETT